MTKSRLITASFIGSVNWYLNCPQNWKQKAYDDLSNQLNRVSWKPTPAIQHGIEFENTVYELVRQGSLDLGTPEFRKVLAKCDGGTFQDKLKAFEVIDGETYCLFGKTDVKFENQIIDIKTTGEFKREKYENSFQHVLYMYITGIEFFEYLVVEWDEFPRIASVNSVDIEQDNPKIEYHDRVVDEVRRAMQFLDERPILKKAYLEKFCL
ncbi:MAG: hypothetical protein GWN64_07795 [Candidatus Thorarchaeota archaeon]|nr:hypothetical protein [Candidatus Thorarchaeota archaeon]